MTQVRHFKHQGFTIIEMMIVVVIISIVVAIGYPGMKKQLADQRLKESVNITENLLKQARSDALISRAEVTSTINPATATSAAFITLTQSINNIPQTQSTNYNPDIVIKALNNMPTTIRFTPDKRVYQEATGTTALATTSAAGYTFCYKGVSTDEYLLTVDAITNVRVNKNGVCP